MTKITFLSSDPQTSTFTQKFLKIKDMEDVSSICTYSKGGWEGKGEVTIMIFSHDHHFLTE